MLKRQRTSYAVSEPPPKRDFELCKVVFTTAISQILYSRRALPPKCFQLLPLPEVVSRSFEDILASGSAVHIHDNELLREQATTLFLRQGADYGLNRFLGILREDIFPLIEHESLVRFRISYLRTKFWGENSLAEYYTVAFKYEPDGTYVLDIWRAGTGKQHTATTDSQLWNLGDYLSRLPSWNESMHWTLAFHATERPDDPPIGVWKFDRTDFDNANLDLQQRDGYSYARIARLEIAPLPLADVDEMISETSPSPEPDAPINQKPSDDAPRSTAPNQTQIKSRQARKLSSKQKSTRSSRNKRPAGGQLSPPATLTSNRNVSKSTTVDKVDEGVAVGHDTGKEISRGAESAHNGLRKGLVTKRKAKKPVQLFEYAASSLPPTQLISESQSLSQKGNMQKAGPSHHQENDLPWQGIDRTDVPRSPSFDPFPLLDGISLSPEPISATQSSPRVGLPQLPPPLPRTQIPMDGFRGLLRLGPLSSVAGGNQGLSQWEPRASPPRNLLGMAISDEEKDIETASEASPETSPGPAKEGSGKNGATHNFSPNTVARRTSLFYDLPSSTGGEEE